MLLIQENTLRHNYKSQWVNVVQGYNRPNSYPENWTKHKFEKCAENA